MKWKGLEEALQDRKILNRLTVGKDFLEVRNSHKETRLGEEVFNGYLGSVLQDEKGLETE